MFKYQIKQILIVLLIVILAGGIFLNIKYNKNSDISKTNNNQEQKEQYQNIETRSLCFYKNKKNEIDLYDRAWLELNISNNKIKGEFQNLPAETDSKIGKFVGIMDQLDQNNMSRSATLLWDSFAEGIETKEELLVKWGDGSATVAFGEMIDRGDGVYVYKNKNNLYWIEQMDQIDCENLREKLYIEKYIRDNIQTISPNKPVLGGIWYVVSVNIDSNLKTGEVLYEDGHIQNKANFKYTIDTENDKVIFNKFKILN